MIEITPKLIKKAKLHASRGLTLEQIAWALGMGESTLYEKREKYPEFSKAIKEGQAEGIGEISNVIFSTARKGNITSAIFYLKTRGGWIEKQQVIHQGESREEQLKRLEEKAKENK